MSNFRIKTKIKHNSNMKDSHTLEIKHRQKIEEIEIKNKSLDKQQNQLNKINDELHQLNSMKENNQYIDLKKRCDLLNKKKQLELTIDGININMDEINYYDLTGDLLTEYYDIRTNKQKVEIKNILEYLSPDNKKKKTINTKADLFERFCQRVEGIRVNKDDGTNRIKYCNYCNIEKTLDMSDSAYICPECGDSEFVIIDEDTLIKEYSPYRRINHFKEWLNQLQAKETTEIPDDIYQTIVLELNKYKNIDQSIITRSKMQDILKKLGYNKLYEHIPFIINKITGIMPPKIDRDTEEKFIEMFTIIQEPWELFKPPNRKNFLSYPYVLYKFSELLEKDHLLCYFPMLQLQKLMEQDIIWGKFCKFLKWEFYPTT
jgi:hypothetical protein